MTAKNKKDTDFTIIEYYDIDSKPGATQKINGMDIEIKEYIATQSPNPDNDAGAHSCMENDRLGAVMC